MRHKIIKNEFKINILNSLSVVLFKHRFPDFFHVNGFLGAAGSAYPATPAQIGLDDRCRRRYSFFL